MEAPFRSFGGVDFFPSLFSKAAALGYYLATSQAFRQGNKRTALATVTLCLNMNGHHLSWSQEEQTRTFQRLGEGSMSREEFERALLKACGYLG